MGTTHLVLYSTWHKAREERWSLKDIARAILWRSITEPDKQHELTVKTVCEVNLPFSEYGDTSDYKVVMDDIRENLPWFIKDLGHNPFCPNCYTLFLLDATNE